MTEVVDSDELLRRIQRARSWAREEEGRWQGRRIEVGATDPEAAQEAAVRALALEAVLGVLDEIVAPGSSRGGG
ncbi:hypothetical protein [Streptomyces tropicalis]|uniref:Uncharacterized protein n=1 Tax=Streptomyces tropicalis TaxID=3034234 RepID=A0ABT6A9C4_9ACTN|nr:hypothetical protein [Streptomyces tropicalis]MDF3301256.1 hypothetical protein [Streptomyces tropicalis]